MFSSYGAGRVAVGEADVFMCPRAHRFDSTVRGVVYCHGSGGDALAGSQTVLAGQYALAHALGAVRPTVICDLGGTNTWGNSTAVARVGQAADFLQGAGGAAAGPVFLVSVSMGNAAAINFALAHPERVAALVGVIPVSDIQAMRVDGGFRAAIDTAWDVTYPDPLPDGANPAGNGPALAGLPYRAYYDLSDAVVSPGTVTALADAIGGTAVAVSSVGHSEGAIQAVPLVDIVTFLAAHS